MSKKSFTGGLNTILGEAQSPAPSSTKRTPSSTTAQEEYNNTDTRATFVLPLEMLEKLRAVAYWRRIHIREALEEALTDYLKAQRPKPRPEEARIRRNRRTEIRSKA